MSTSVSHSLLCVYIIYCTPHQRRLRTKTRTYRCTVSQYSCIHVCQTRSQWSFRSRLSPSSSARSICLPSSRTASRKQKKKKKRVQVLDKSHVSSQLVTRQWRIFFSFLFSVLCITASYWSVYLHRPPHDRVRAVSAEERAALERYWESWGMTQVSTWNSVSPDIHFSTPFPTNTWFPLLHYWHPGRTAGKKTQLTCTGSAFTTIIDQRFYLASCVLFFIFFKDADCLSNLGHWRVLSLLLELLHCSLLNVFIMHIYKYIKEEEIPFYDSRVYVKRIYSKTQTSSVGCSLKGVLL